jgi:hypothetical protein
MNKIFNFGKTSLYIGEMLDVSPWGEKVYKYIPKFFYFDGGSYFKIGFYFLYHIFEFSRSKKDKNTYKQVTSEELDNIIKTL